MRRLFGILRVFGLALVIVAIIVTMTFRCAEASLVESLRGLGDQLAHLYDATPNRVPRKLVVNGVEFGVMTVSTPLEVPAALDRFQDLCRSIEQLDLPATVRQKLEQGRSGRSSVPLSVLRQDAETEGLLACLDVGDGLDAEGLLSNLTDFGRTLNLRDLGQLRYVLARREQGTTTLIVFWTEGDVRLAEMFPKVADAPGRDLAGFPRPEHGKRLLSAFEQGMPYGFASYGIEGQTSQAVVDAYRAMLEAQGYPTHLAKDRALIAQKYGRTVLVRVTARRPGRVVVSVSDLG